MITKEDREQMFETPEEAENYWKLWESIHRRSQTNKNRERRWRKKLKTKKGKENGK